MYNTQEIEKRITVMEDSLPTAITSQETYDAAVAYGKNVSKMEKFLKGEKEKITKPLNESLKAARALFKPYEEKCAEVKADIKGKMVAYLAEEEKKKQKEEESDLARLERGTMKEETVVKKMVTRNESATDTTGTTTRVLVIKDVDLSKVPVEYLVLDESKVKADFRAGTDIPGVTLEYETRARL